MVSFTLKLIMVPVMDPLANGFAAFWKPLPAVWKFVEPSWEVLGGSWRCFKLRPMLLNIVLGFRIEDKMVPGITTSFWIIFSIEYESLSINYAIENRICTLTKYGIVQWELKWFCCALQASLNSCLSQMRSSCAKSRQDGRCSPELVPKMLWSCFVQEDVLGRWFCGPRCEYFFNNICIGWAPSLGLSCLFATSHPV